MSDAPKVGDRIRVVERDRRFDVPRTTEGIVFGVSPAHKIVTFGGEDGPAAFYEDNISVHATWEKIEPELPTARNSVIKAKVSKDAEEFSIWVLGAWGNWECASLNPAATPEEVRQNFTDITVLYDAGKEED